MRKKGAVYSREAFSRGREFIRSNTVRKGLTRINPHNPRATYISHIIIWLC